MAEPTRFELLDHPADIGFRTWGDSLETLFANCAYALSSIILDPSHIAADRDVTITAEGCDVESLLVNWLNEVLYYVDSKRLAFESFQVRFPEAAKVFCEARAEYRDPEKHPVRLLVKAVTYHQLKVSTSDGQWLAEVYVDV
jgi:SHS2 domain-containing protein